MQKPPEATVTASDEVHNRIISSHRSSEERHTERYLENISNDTTHVIFGERGQNNMALTLLDVNSNRILSGIHRSITSPIVVNLSALRRRSLATFAAIVP